MKLLKLQLNMIYQFNFTLVSKTFILFLLLGFFLKKKFFFKIIGFGDNDLDLLLANPLHLRPLIEKFPDVKIVLLHSSYPYTREAGYLVSVYNNVYVDFGLVFPQLSPAGQLNNLKQLVGSMHVMYYII